MKCVLKALLLLIDEKEVGSFIRFRFVLTKVGMIILKGFRGWSAVQSQIDRKTCVCYLRELE